MLVCLEKIIIYIFGTQLRFLLKLNNINSDATLLTLVNIQEEIFFLPSNPLNPNITIAAILPGSGTETGSVEEFV